MSDDKVKFNGKEISKSELDQKIEESKKKKGVSIEEVSPDTFVQRIRG